MIYILPKARLYEGPSVDEGPSAYCSTSCVGAKGGVESKYGIGQSTKSGFLRILISFKYFKKKCFWEEKNSCADVTGRQ